MKMSRELLALQYTSFALSSFTTLFRNVEIVLERPFVVFIIDVDSLVMFTVSLYHKIYAAGLLADVLHIRFISCPAFTVIDVGVKATDDTGTVQKNK